MVLLPFIFGVNMAKANKKYKAWREKHGYPIGPKSVGKSTVDVKGPTISSPNKHVFKKVINKGK